HPHQRINRFQTAERVRLRFDAAAPSIPPCLGIGAFGDLRHAEISDSRRRAGFGKWPTNALRHARSHLVNN
ncbi:MAG: hypothetical protein ABSB35_39485, partial [Bryobacteraceae bacterium]